MKGIKKLLFCIWQSICVTLNDLHRYKYNPILSISLLRAVKGKAKRITLFRGNKEYKQLNIYRNLPYFLHNGLLNMSKLKIQDWKYKIRKYIIKFRSRGIKLFSPLEAEWMQLNRTTNLLIKQCLTWLKIHGLSLTRSSQFVSCTTTANLFLT